MITQMLDFTLAGNYVKARRLSTVTPLGFLALVMATNMYYTHAMFTCSLNVVRCHLKQPLVHE
jgi:hypothetical protein